MVEESQKQPGLLEKRCFLDNPLAVLNRTLTRVLFQHCYRLICSCYWLCVASVFSRSLFILWGFLVTSQPNQISFGGFSNKLIKPFSEKNKLSKWLPESTCFFHTADHYWNNWCSFDLPTHKALLLAYFMLTKFGSTQLRILHGKTQMLNGVLFKNALLRDREEKNLGNRQDSNLWPLYHEACVRWAASTALCDLTTLWLMVHGLLGPWHRNIKLGTAVFTVFVPDRGWTAELSAGPTLQILFFRSESDIS